jgi:hypothetical protein
MKQLSRPKRWAAATCRAETAISKLQDLVDEIQDAVSELSDIKQEYEDWKDSLPENLASSPLAEKLEEVSNLDLDSIGDSLSSAVDDAENTISEAAGLDLPRGFGRD